MLPDRSNTLDLVEVQSRRTRCILSDQKSIRFGTDTIRGGRGNDVIQGGGRTDYQFGRGGDDRIYGFSDKLTVSNADDVRDYTHSMLVPK